MKSFEIIYIQGLIELILSSILIAILIYCDVISFEYYLNEIRTKLGYVLLIIFFSFAYYSQLYIIIDFFSPFHIFLVILIFYIFGIFLSTGMNMLEIIASILIICSGLFFVLVFTEIIELNCFGLSYMTKRNIALRAELDIDLDEDINSDDKSDKEIPMGEYTIELENKMPEELNMLDINYSKEE